jgi:hypothetical protein
MDSMALVILWLRKCRFLGGAHGCRYRTGSATKQPETRLILYSASSNIYHFIPILLELH